MPPTDPAAAAFHASWEKCEKDFPSVTNGTIKALVESKFSTASTDVMCFINCVGKFMMGLFKKYVTQKSRFLDLLPGIATLHEDENINLNHNTGSQSSLGVTYLCIAL